MTYILFKLQCLFFIFQLPIKVIDVNDHQPSFAKESHVVDISENQEVGSVILTLEASDEDELDRNLIYSIYNR